MLRNAFSRVKNAFQRIVEREQKADVSLGMPSIDKAHQDRRMNAMSMMTGGRGFQVPKKGIRRYSDGTTRGERKRAARAACNAIIREVHESAWARTAITQQVAA